MLVPYAPELHGLPLYILSTNIREDGGIEDVWKPVEDKEVAAQAQLTPWLFALEVPDSELTGSEGEQND